MRSQVGTGELVARLFMAWLLAGVSAGFLWYTFAFCSLVGGAHPGGGAMWWRAVLGKLYLSFDPGFVSWPLSILLLLSGGLGLHDLGVIMYRIARELMTDFGRRPIPTDLQPPAGERSG